MRFASILAAVSFVALGSGVACSSNSSDISDDGTGGFGGFISTGGFGNTNTTGPVTGSGGFATSFGGSGGFVTPTGGSSGFGGAGGTTVLQDGGPADAAEPGPDATAPHFPTPTACADPRQKQCGGPCEFLSPANGCSLTTCVDCPSVLNAVQVCKSAACGFQCNPGYTTSGDHCVRDGDTDAGTLTSDGSACSIGGQCASGVCKNGECAPSRCDDRIKNGLETAVDCGGSCAPCEKGKTCSKDTDCDDGPCTNGVCGCTPHTCTDPALSGQCGDNLNDHCGGIAVCGCGSGQTCYQSACCNPQAACTAGGCGTVSACGSTVDCGTSSCTGKQACFQNKCCNPLAKCPANSCGNVDDGCGSTIPCGGCTDGKACTQNTCQCDGTDTDGDGISDCDEIADGKDWTDPNVFNGLVGKTYDNCTDGKCTSIDTNAEVTACTNKTVVEGHNLSSGWNFGDTNASRCDPSYGFTPNWTQSCNDNSFSVSYTGFINLQTGTNCFDIVGDSGNFLGQGCASFSLDNSDSEVVTHDSGKKCFNVTQAGGHPVRLFLDRVDSLIPANMGVKLEHCLGNNCALTVVPQTDLRVSN